MRHKGQAAGEENDGEGILGEVEDAPISHKAELAIREAAMPNEK